jgi:hypothetical protein
MFEYPDLYSASNNKIESHSYNISFRYVCDLHLFKISDDSSKCMASASRSHV